MVPSVSSPWARLDTRCSTTETGLYSYDSDEGWPLASEESASVSSFVTTLVTHREAVWKGACGMRPLGKGRPRRPETPVVRPRRKRSQWKPAGLRRGNSVPWAMREETEYVVLMVCRASYG